ncbi:hypothetical protein [Streptomyces sp. NPDC058086]|uniref:hypothetical protein n=1 Tax=Streptomyces sp. NPDC058086 TaxID=3346334 RepID=UPI0036E3D495
MRGPHDLTGLADGAVLASYQTKHPEGIAVNICIEVEILIQFMNRRAWHLVRMVKLKTVTKSIRAKSTSSTPNVVLRPGAIHPCGLIRRAISRTFRAVIIPQFGADIVYENWRISRQHIVRVLRGTPLPAFMQVKHGLLILIELARRT